MKITRQQQNKLAGRIAHRYLKSTLDLIERGCKTPARLGPWVDLIGIHNMIPDSWNARIEIGPRQAKNIIAAAKSEVLQAIRHLDQYEPIRVHLSNMASEKKDISGQPLPRKDPKYVIAEWGIYGRGFLKDYKIRDFPHGAEFEWTEDASEAKIFPTRRGAKAKASQLYLTGPVLGPIAVGCRRYNDIVKSFEPTA